MKLTWKQIDPFLKSPDPAARVVLIYGPDSGLVKDRTKTVGLHIVSDLHDPFNTVSLNAEQIAEDPARLNDEANAMSMMGGARLIRITDGADKITPTLKAYLENPSLENLILIEASELGPKSPLRQLCEKAKNAAALPCYVEEGRNLNTLIRDTLKEEGFTIQADAQGWLAQAIGGDRLRVMGELEKLIVYMGKPPANISLDDVQASCGDAGAQGLDDLVYALAGGQTEIALKSFHKLHEEGIADVTILRSLQNHFRRLHFIQSLIAANIPITEALKSLQPPIFFRLEDSFRAQLSRWSLTNLGLILERLAQLEAQTKQTGNPVNTLISQAILSISRIGNARAA